MGENEVRKMAKTDFLYESVRDAILASLEKGTVPWHLGWSFDTTPRNYDTGRIYSGINMLTLAMLGKPSPFWITFKSIQRHGARLKKGAQSYPVLYWEWFVKEEVVKLNPDMKKETRYAVVFYYRVFNVADVEGLPEKKVTECEPLRDAEDIVASYEGRPRILHEVCVPHYNVVRDEVMLPPIGVYDTRERYYSTLFHELVHSTGHPARLNRNLTGFIKGDEFAEEELVAEFGAAYLCAHAGISSERLIENHAAYIKNWYERIKDGDIKMVVNAAQRARRAADYILGVTYGNAPEPGTVEPVPATA